MKHALGIDIGTTKICLVHFDLDTFEMLNLKSVDNSSTTACKDPSCHEQDPSAIWDLTLSLLTEMQGSLSSVQFIAITGQMHGVLLLDEDNQPATNFITWRDARFPAENTPEGFDQVNGCQLRTGYGANSVLGLVRSMGRDFSGCKACSITSFVMGKLCGDYRIDESMAASFGVYDILNKRWNAEQLDSIGLDRGFFGEVVPSCTPVAPLLPTLCEQLGMFASVKVYSPIGDNQASVIGAIGFSHLGVINIGTSGQLSVPGNQMHFSPSIEVRPLVGHGYMQVYSSLCGGWAYAYLKDFCKDLLSQFGYEASDREIFNVLDRKAAESLPGETLLVDTSFLGTRENHSLRGSITQVGTTNFTIAHLAQGFIKGILRELHHTQISMEGIPFLVASGNAVRKSPVMKQAIEEEFGLACKFPPFLEEASVGSILASHSHLDGKDRILHYYSMHYAR